jgi:sulfite exporter TauE/SafE
VAGFFFLGGVLGSLGAGFKFSNTTLGLLTFLTGAVMLILGLKLTELFPRLESFALTLPSAVSKKLGFNLPAHPLAAAFVSGGLTFFLPCGFTQAMQIYAVGTGSFLYGGLVMGLFALGTAPGLLGVGGLASFFKGASAKKFFKFAGVVVVLLGLLNLRNGWYVGGFSSFFDRPVEAGSVATVNSANDNSAKQIIEMTEVARGYEPNEFTIKKGVPVEWRIDAQAPFSCAASLVIPKLRIMRYLEAGKNVIEFTPTEAGDLAFSCSMGMYRGVFHVRE